MPDHRHVVLIHGTWGRGDSWTPRRFWWVFRSYCEIVFPFLDRGNATTVDFGAVRTPVLTLRAEYDLLVPPQIAPKTAARYQKGTLVDVAGSDHLVVSGAALPITTGHIDAWIAHNRGLFAA